MPKNSVVFQVLQIDKDLHVSVSPNLMTMHFFIKNYEMINSSNLGVGGSIQCLSKKKMKELFHRSYESLSYSQLANNPKARLYLSFKRKPTYETYLKTVKDRKIRVQYTKLKLSDHNLEIESGRHKKIERQQRFCSSCNSYNIGDELHFLFECSELYLIRAVFFQKILKRYPDLNNLDKQQKFIFLCTSERKKDTREFSKYISELFNEKYRLAHFTDVWSKGYSPNETDLSPLHLIFSK